MKVELCPGEKVEVVFEGTDGVITVDFNSCDDDKLTVHADMPDTEGREGIIYEEDFSRTPEEMMGVDIETSIPVNVKFDDPVIRIAHRFYDTQMAPGHRASGVPEDGIDSMLAHYLEGVRQNPEAQKELQAWSEKSEMETLRQDRHDLANRTQHAELLVTEARQILTTVLGWEKFFTKVGAGILVRRGDEAVLEHIRQWLEDAKPSKKD